MNASLSTAVLAWLATYAIHSTLLLGAAWLLTRRAVTSPSARDIIWKVALVGGVLTSLVQQRTPPPIGSVVTFTTESTPSTATSTPAGVVAKQSLPAGVEHPAVVPAQRSINIDQTPTWRERMSARLASIAWSTVVVGAWASLALLLSIAYVARRLILTGRLENRRAVVEGPLPGMLAQLCRDVQHTTAVRLTWVNTIASPVALGAREICVPEAVLTQLSVDEQRSLLAHELAHLTRRDPTWLALSAIVERVFFFQPLNRVARAAMQRNAEFVCDDWAATQSGSGLPLAHCLARVAEWMEAPPLSVPVAGMAEHRSLLVTRVARLLEARRTSPTLPRAVITAGTIAALVVTTAAAPAVRSTRGDRIGTRPTAMAVDSLATGDQIESASTLPDTSRSRRVAATTPMDRTAMSVAAIGGMVDTNGAGEPSDGARNALATDADSERDRQTNLSSRAAPTLQDTAVVSALIERLKDRDPGVRAAAASSLGRLKSRRAVNALVAAMDDGSKDVRVAVMEALAELEDRAALPALMKGLTDGSVDVRMHALDGLEHFSDEVRASALATLVKDGSADVRRRAISLLGETADRSALPSLVTAVRDGNAEVRVAALDAIAKFGEPSVAPSLVSALGDGNREVRRAAVAALCELHAPLPESLMMTLLNDESPEVRVAALEYLREHPTMPVIPAIRKLLDDESDDVRETAVEALAEYRDPAARDALRAALKHEDPKVRRRAADALGDRK